MATIKIKGAFATRSRHNRDIRYWYHSATRHRVDAWTDPASGEKATAEWGTAAFLTVRSNSTAMRPEKAGFKIGTLSVGAVDGPSIAQFREEAVRTVDRRACEGTESEAGTDCGSHHNHSRQALAPRCARQPALRPSRRPATGRPRRTFWARRA